MRTDCLVCGAELPKRFRRFCSTSCRQKETNRRYRAYQKEWQRKRREKIASVPEQGKLQCKICGGWYVQIGSHVSQVHGMTAREYREKYGYPVKKGVVPLWYRELKGEIAMDNETYHNLREGSKYWYDKGDKRAKESKFLKGKISPKKYREIYGGFDN